MTQAFASLYGEDSWDGFIREAIVCLNKAQNKALMFNSIGT